MDPRMLEIVSNRPELVTALPRWMFPESVEKELQTTEGLAIGEIAGRDSIAAVLEAVKKQKLKALLPTIAYTGTEFGDWAPLFKKIGLLAQELAGRSVKVFDPVLLGAPRWWRHLCGRYVPSLFDRFGFYSPCAGCHLYLHALRIPLARRINCKIIIGGERESHEGKVKINQTAAALDACTAFAGSFGIDLFLPLRKISRDEDIASIIGRQRWEADKQLGCVLSGNYLDETGKVTCREEDIKRFFSEYAIAEADRLVREVLTAP
jgi:hypothetical protein